MVETVYILLALSVISTVVGFLLKQALSDRDARINILDAQNKLVCSAIKNLQTKAAVCENRHDTSQRDFRQLLHITEKLDEKLDRLQ